MRIISDIHGKYIQYSRIIKGRNYTLCLGDVGFDYWPWEQGGLKNHKFIRGNHDNVDDVKACHGYLGDYGFTSFGGLEFFYYSGSFSFDKEWRIVYNRLHPLKPKIWWADEELNYRTAGKALALYKKKKPDLVFSHDCPSSVSKLTGNPDVLRNFNIDPVSFRCVTQEVLEECFSYHTPKLWLYGHYHHEVDQVINGTRFMCRPELGWTDVSPDLKITDASIGLKLHG